MDAQDFEFLLTRYLDGTLSPEQRLLVEQRLQSDPPAQALLAEYRCLDAMMRREAAHQPSVQWDQLAEHISDAVADHADRRNFTIRLCRGAAGLAMAAAVLLVVGIFGPSTPTSPTLFVAGPQAQVAAGTEVLDISVGKPQEADAAPYASEGVRVSHSMVALVGFTPAAGGIQ